MCGRMAEFLKLASLIYFNANVLNTELILFDQKYNILKNYFLAVLSCNSERKRNILVLF